jgi:hypothetical protein
MFVRTNQECYSCNVIVTAENRALCQVMSVVLLLLLLHLTLYVGIFCIIASVTATEVIETINS